jgi:pheromone a factor receptor
MSSAARTRRRWIEAALCFGIPLLSLILVLTAVGHRYDIVEDLGCSGPLYLSWLSLLVWRLPSLLIAAAALTYAGEFRWKLWSPAM